MRSIRLISGAVLIATVGALLLITGSYFEATLSAQATEASLNALHAQALIAAQYAEQTEDPPAAIVRWLAALTGTRVLLFDAGAAVLADSAGAQARPSAGELYVSPFRGQRVDGGVLRAGAALSEGRALVLAAPSDNAISSRQQLRSYLLGAFIVLSLLALAAAAWAWRSVDAALEDIEATADRLRGGMLQARVSEARRGRFSGLVASVNEAIDRIARGLINERGQSRYYGAILDQMSDAVVAIDERGHIQFINRSSARLFGIEPGDAAGLRLENVTLNYELSALVTRAMEQGAVQRTSLRLTHPRERLFEGVATPLIDEDGRTIGAVALLHDLTIVREASRIRQEFVANASHELRTPAAGIKALAEALQAGALRDPQRGPQFAQQIVDAADRLTDILNDMLTLTRVERGAQLLEPRMLHVCTALEDASSMVRPAAVQKQISLHTQCDEGDQVYADQASLRTLLLNLLDNAVKYTPPGGAVTVRGRAVSGGYELSVADTGAGIPAEHLERIFERFYRVDRARDRATGGTGLGLSIVKHIAEAHGGRVRVTSREGEGSTFMAFFPEP